MAKRTPRSRAPALVAQVTVATLKFENIAAELARRSDVDLN